MLHERNAESVLYFKENEEAAFFDGPEELVEKVKEFMANDVWREKIRIAGHKRAQEENSLDERARQIITQLKSLV